MFFNNGIIVDHPEEFPSYSGIYDGLKIGIAKSNLAGANNESLSSLFYVACAIGTYLSNYVCTPCEIGYTTAAYGATDTSQCNVCDIGYYKRGSICTLCPWGTTTLFVGATSMAQCGKTLLLLSKISPLS
jgi:hypothetical protein